MLVTQPDTSNQPLGLQSKKRKLIGQHSFKLNKIGVRRPIEGITIYDFNRDLVLLTFAKVNKGKSDLNPDSVPRWAYQR